MKTLILAMLLTVTTLTARAGNEGPQAAPVQPKPQIIAQVIQGGGMRPPNVPHSISIDILANGQVQETQNYQDGKVKVRALAKLAPAVLAKIKSLVSEIKDGELVAVEPDAPACMDAPGTTYIAIHADGQQAKISATYGCKDYQKADAVSADYTLENILSGLRGLAAAR